MTPPRDREENPPFRMTDRFDLIGVVFGLAVFAALTLVGLPVLLSVVFACAALNLTAFALRRRAGVPQTTVWQGARRWARR